MAGREEGKQAAVFQSVWTDAVWSDKESVVKGVNSYESEMNRQDLLELYQLVVMYTRCYDSELGELLKEISEKYKNNTGGEDIRSSRNPRCAGRKRVYAENTDRTILELRNNGMTLRGIAGKLQCSIGHVQDVLKRWEG